MSLSITQVSPRRRFLSSRVGLGHLVPLGHLLVGGPLLDAGHRVSLVDGDLEGWSDETLAGEVGAREPDLIFLGHHASYAAHPAAMRTARALRRRLPRTPIVYGGSYPTYADEEVLARNPEIDIVVRGEGEAIALELAAALEASEGRIDRQALGEVAGITFREGERILRNRPRALITDLDAYRPGWELVDFSRYPLLGLGPTAGFYLSRGCPHRCTFCGQFDFWKRWRHRSPANVVKELRILVERYGVRSVWLADENFGAHPRVAHEVLQAIVDADLGLTLNLDLTAVDVVKQAKLLPLYKRAGVEHVTLGIEALDAATTEHLEKEVPADVSREAVRLLREHGIFSLAMVMYGFQEERPARIGGTLRRLLQIDPDVVNAVYLTPLFWTREGARTDPSELLTGEQERFNYREPVLRPRHLGVGLLFGLVKLTELFFHGRPRVLLRALFDRERGRRKMLRGYLRLGIRIWFAEIAQFVGRRLRESPEPVAALPGAPPWRPAPGREDTDAPRRELRSGPLPSY